MRTTLLALILAATACKSDEAPKVSAATTTAAPAGTVVDVKGTVSVAGKPLAKGDSVAADALIDTGADSSVTILLAHNGVKLELGANKHVRVNESIAWKAPKRVEPGAGPDDATESAGRPAERSAAETAITATATESEKADRAEEDDEDGVAVPAPPPPPKPTTKETAPAPGGANKSGGGKHADTDGGGLGLTGTGEGGGGTATGGLGIGGVGTIGHGAGTGDGAGYGTGKGSLGGGRTAKAPKVTQGKPEVSGSLPPEVVRRIIRQRMTQLRYCYEQGLAKNPALAGKVVVKFTIGKDGAVVQAMDGGSTIGDSAVIACAVTVFRRMSFPAPEGGGIVNVSYPIVFAPSP